MAQGIDIRNLDSLKSLKASLQQTSERGLNILPSLDNILKREFETIKQVERQKQKVIGQCEDHLQSYSAALERCEREGYNCDDLRSAVNRAYRALEDARDKYQNCKRIVAGVKAAIEKLNKAKVKFKNLLQQHTPFAAHALQQLINGAEDYQSIQSHGSRSSGSIQGTISSTTSQASSGNPVGEILMAATGASALATLAHELFHTSSGESYELSSSSRGNHIDFQASHNGATHKTARLTIHEKEGKRVGKIFNLRVSDSELSEKVLRNIEQTAQQNQCGELSAWANQKQVSFFQDYNYKTRKSTPTGAEVYKPLS